MGLVEGGACAFDLDLLRGWSRVELPMAPHTQCVSAPYAKSVTRRFGHASDQVRPKKKVHLEYRPDPRGREEQYSPAQDRSPQQGKVEISSAVNRRLSPRAKTTTGHLSDARRPVPLAGVPQEVTLARGVRTQRFSTSHLRELPLPTVRP